MTSAARSQCSLALCLLGALALGPGCSALVAPDPSRLGGGPDAGPGVDSGPSGLDAGPMDDTGPIDVDAGPGDSDAGPLGDAGNDARPGCAPGCVGTTLTTCAGGTPTVATCDLGCAPGGARCGEMVPSNVTATLLSAGTRDLSVDASGAAFDTSTCAAVSVDSMVVAQSGGPELCVLVVHNVRIEGILSITGRRPLAIIASGDVEIDGVIDVSAQLARPGPGGGNGGTPSARSGAGAAPGAGGEHVGTYADGGGGGGGYCGVGGDGGSGSTVPFARGGVGGMRIDPRELSPLVGGSGGGVGPGGEPATGGRGNSGLGGGGGGAVQISSPVRIRIFGSIVAGGGGGIGGRNSDLYTNWGAGGGGGSGGAVLLEAPEIEIGGRLVATGGAGASSGGSGFVGINGEDGLGLDPASGGLASASATENYSAAGGDSGGGTAVDGLDGESNAYNGSNGGGGGGGAGCLVLRTPGGVDPGGARSPSTGVAVLPLRLR